MTQTQREKSTQSGNNTPWSVDIFRKVGYALLLFSLIEIIGIFIPMNLLNPSWQLETFGSLVGRIPVPLMALAFVFFGEDKFRSDFEITILKALRQICLIFGVLLLLMIPLGVINTFQSNTLNKAQITSQYQQQIDQIERFEALLNQTKDQDLERFIKSQGRTLDGQSPQAAKEQFLSKLKKDKNRMKMMFEGTKATRKLTLIKNSVKWNLGALIGGILFIYIWYLTQWAL